MNSHSTMKLDQEESTLSLNDDCVQIEAVYTAVIPSQKGACSMVGRVVEVGKKTISFSVGDIVVAFAPVKPEVTLEAGSCWKVQNTWIINESMAFWAFALALIPVIHLSEIEIGEQVLVLSNNLVGQMVADLALLAGAISCVVVDPTYADSFDPTMVSEPPHGLRHVSDLPDLDMILPDLSVDLLIDASGDSIHFQSNFEMVRNLGRLLTIGQYSSSRFDFNVYPDLHKRSLKLLNYRLPTTLEELNLQDGQHPSQMNHSLDFVQRLFETGRLRPATWSTVHLKNPTEDMLIHGLQDTDRGGLLIEW